MSAKKRGRSIVKRAVLRADRSPMNSKIWCYQLECGHEVYMPGRKRSGPVMRCTKCESKNV